MAKKMAKKKAVLTTTKRKKVNYRPNRSMKSRPSQERACRYVCGKNAGIAKKNRKQCRQVCNNMKPYTDAYGARRLSGSKTIKGGLGGGAAVLVAIQNLKDQQIKVRDIARRAGQMLNPGKRVNKKACHGTKKVKPLARCGKGKVRVRVVSGKNTCRRPVCRPRRASASGAFDMSGEYGYNGPVYAPAWLN